MRLLKETAIYMVGTGLGRGLPFLLLPVLTLYLSVADYGKLSLGTTIAGFLAIVIGMNPNLYVFAKFFKYDKAVFSVKLYNILLISLVTCIPVLLLYVFIEDQLHTFSISLTVFLALVVIGLSRAVAAMHLAVFQMQRKPLSYLVFYVLLAGSVACVLFFLIAMDRFEWYAMLFIEAISLFILNIFYLCYLRRGGFLSFQINKDDIREFANFSLPLLTHAGALWAVSFLDRFFIAKFSGVEAVGVYSVAHTIALGLSLVHESLHRAWQPIFYRKMQEGDERERVKIIRYTWVYFGLTIMLAVVYFFLVRTLLSFFLPEGYAGVYVVLPYLIIGFSLLGMYRFAAGYFYHYSNTGILSLITVICSISHILIMVYLVSSLGTIGAAYAMVFTYLLLLVSTMVLVKKYHGVKWI